MSFFYENEQCGTSGTENNGNSGRWSHKEHEIFLEAMNMYGKDWVAVSQRVRTRTLVQTRTHAQKYFEKIERNENFNSTYNFTKAISRRDSFSEKHQHGANNFAMFRTDQQLPFDQSRGEPSSYPNNGLQFSTSDASSYRSSSNCMYNEEGVVPMSQDDDVDSIQLPPIMLKLGIQLEVVPATFHCNSNTNSHSHSHSTATSISSSYTSSSSSSISSMMSNEGFTNSTFYPSSYPMSNLQYEHQLHHQLQHQLQPQVNIADESRYHSVISLPIQCHMSIHNKTLPVASPTWSAHHNSNANNNACFLNNNNNNISNSNRISKENIHLPLIIIIELWSDISNMIRIIMGVIRGTAM